jgi:hypothetical protein
MSDKSHEPQNVHLLFKVLTLSSFLTAASIALPPLAT